MPVTAIVGANWGDEGKGKLTHMLARNADLVVRFQGGKNAGHTVVDGGRSFVLHQLPCGVLWPGVQSLLGPGMALDRDALRGEFEALAHMGLPTPDVRVSDRAQVLLPHHAQLDALEEERLGDRSFGSTRSGIAPCYGDKYRKLGLTVGELLDSERRRERTAEVLQHTDLWLSARHGAAPVDRAGLEHAMERWARWLEPRVCDSSELLHQALTQDKGILLEAQLGALRDPDHGIYPYSTSSSTLAGYACVGAGLPPWAIERVIAVTKAYSTCVGAGPFVSELDAREAALLRDRGGEYGRTTGRPRRIGHFDAVATRHGARAQGATELAVTMLDILDPEPSLKICHAYELDGAASERFLPAFKLQRARPVYETLPGWRCDTSEVRSRGQLPGEARAYLERIEALVGVPLGWISVGPTREASFRYRD